MPQNSRLRTAVDPHKTPAFPRRGPSCVGFVCVCFRFRLPLRGFFLRAADAQLNSKRRDSPSQSPCSSAVVITTDPRQARKKRARGCLGVLFGQLAPACRLSGGRSQKKIEVALRDAERPGGCARLLARFHESPPAARGGCGLTEKGTWPKTARVFVLFCFVNDKRAHCGRIRTIMQVQKRRKTVIRRAVAGTLPLVLSNV